ncbi:hypothetical protein Pelo_10322 [Pelomyxa schiedti]|nr:hypothetical protein Pelo_10322 [Pelomyxa schiedti]
MLSKAKTVLGRLLMFLALKGVGGEPGLWKNLRKKSFNVQFSKIIKVLTFFFEVINVPPCRNIEYFQTRNSWTYHIRQLENTTHWCTKGELNGDQIISCGFWDGKLSSSSGFR